MIHETKGNIIKAQVEALVNTVNCEGYMGKGIALQYKKAFPLNFNYYSGACRRKELHPGTMLVWDSGDFTIPRYIINFPTKDKWRAKSRYEYIEKGLEDLVRVIRAHHISSIAIPPLGCGLGGLEWSKVEKMITTAFEQMDDIDVRIYPPQTPPKPEDQPIRTTKPKMTKARAMFLLLVKQYEELSYSLTLLEAQKIAYFLQESGEQMKLNYVQYHYGPYAHNLNMLIERLEGHYITGYGDQQSKNSEIRLIHRNLQEATDLIKYDCFASSHLQSVAELIEGFETPYGMELLATVHWAALKLDKPAKSLDEVIENVHRWSNRKKHFFDRHHIEVAYNRLRETHWLSA